MVHSRLTFISIKIWWLTNFSLSRLLSFARSLSLSCSHYLLLSLSIALSFHHLTMLSLPLFPLSPFLSPLSYSHHLLTSPSHPHFLTISLSYSLTLFFWLLLRRIRKYLWLKNSAFKKLEKNKNLKEFDKNISSVAVNFSRDAMRCDAMRCINQRCFGVNH